jgi:hypothetical protein
MFSIATADYLLVVQQQKLSVAKKILINNGEAWEIDNYSVAQEMICCMELIYS